MNEPPDPFEALRALNPVDAADVRGERASPRAREALERIVTTNTARARDPERRQIPRARRRKAYLLALIPVAAAAAAGAWALTHGATKHLTIGCYANLSLESRTVVVPANGSSSVQRCRDVWRRGDFGSPSSPRLQACVLPSGAVGVFPSPNGGACQQLKLAPAAAGAPTTTSAPQRRGSATTLRDALVPKFLARPCMDRREAVSTINEELRKQRLNDWAVRISTPFSPARPCASLGFEEEQRLVVIVPVPKLP